MKRFFTLCALFALVIATNADDRRWDFTNWSQETLSNLAADLSANGGERWTDIEKAGGTNPNGGTCYWWVPAGTTELTTLVNGVETIIPETAGLTFNCERGRALALGINHTVDTETYKGSSYLWMGSKNQSFVIPDVKPGATIKMGVESHKPSSDARGVHLEVNGTAIKIVEGSEKPKEYTECSWTIPSDISEDATVPVKVTNSNGCHVYYIEVIETAPAVENANIAYVYDSSYPNYSIDADMIHGMLTVNDWFQNVTVVPLDVQSDLSLVDKDSLTKFNVVVLSATLAETCNYASTLKSAMAYVPMLNLGTALYKTWGYGESATTTGGNVTVPENEWNNSLFQPRINEESLIAEDGTLSLLEAGAINGVTIPEGSYFANDDVLATADGNTAIHIHNADRNAYMLLPYGTGMGDNILEGSAYEIITNAVNMLNFSKSEVPQAVGPTFFNSYKQMNTDVTIKSDTKDAKIYYTVDGTTPTDASTPYTEPVNVTTEGTVINAIAYADGYTASEVTSSTISIFPTSNAPAISVVQEDGKTTVTITNNEEGATVYYNVTGSDSINASTVYSAPLVIKNQETITAFAGEANGKKQSESVSMVIDVKGKTVRTNVVSHFDANKADFSGGESKVKYYTEGKKNGYMYYTRVDSALVTSSEGLDSMTYTLEPANQLTVWNPGNGWEAKSYGQGLMWENITVSKDIDDTNTAARYRAETALDDGASNNSISIGNVRKSNNSTNDPYSASVQSTEAFQGPFNIVAYVGNASSSNTPKADIYVSNDTTNEESWTKIDSVFFSSTQRYIKKTTLSYEGTDKVFVKLQARFSSVMIFDIYIMNTTEPTGIKDINQKEENAGELVRTQIYSLNGTQLGKAAKGINIIKEVYSNGTVKTRKVVVK